MGEQSQGVPPLDPAVKARIDQMAADFMPQVRAEAWKVYQRAPHALDLDEMVSLGLLGMSQAVAAWPAYCLVPETPVLTADLRWVPIGSLEVDQELVGVDEMNPEGSGGGGGRAYRASKVVSVGRRTAECVRVVFSDGREVTCTEEHPWLLKRAVGAYRAKRLGIRSGSYGWYLTSELKPGHKVAAPLRVWPQEGTFESGWLSGIYDGEGSVGRSSVQVAQNPGVVLDRIRAILDSWGIPYTLNAKTVYPCMRLEVCSRRYALELMGRLRPVRLAPKARGLWEDRKIYNRDGSCVEVVSVEPAGAREVVVLETSTATFLANGLVSHNCHRNGYDPNATQYLIAYILRRVKGAMLDALRSQDWVTRSSRTKAKILRDAGQDLGLDEETLARRAGMTVREVRETIAAVSARPVSLDAEVHDVASADGTESQAVVGSVLKEFMKAVTARSPEARALVALRYYYQLSLAECAEVIGITEDEAARLHQEVILACHSAMIRAVT